MMLKVNKIDKLRYYDVCYDIEKEDLYNFFKKDLNLNPKELEFCNEDDLEIDYEQDVEEKESRNPFSPKVSNRKAVGAQTPRRKSISLMYGEQTPCLTKTNTVMGYETQRNRKDSGNSKKAFSQYINNSGDRKNPITKTAEDTDINVEINRLKMQIKNYTNVQNKANTGLFSVAAELESNNMSIKNMLCKFLLNNKF